MRHYILGTAGHVDHGKTELVKALTGRDTDRLNEEKERGISIELGFAPLELDENTFLGIVDAPGHERFIKNMVAGAGGLDLALLLVAADEGVMLQTREHLEVLKALGISSGMVVISKFDLASGDMHEILRSEILDLVAGTFLEKASIIETSSKTGYGLDELKTQLLKACSEIAERDADGPFRMPVDRVFIKEGIGIVVTGSCYSGSIQIGDRMDLLPSQKKVRIREIQSFNDTKKSGGAGERLAIALQGIKTGEVQRGDVLVSQGKFKISTLIDARIKIAEYKQFVLKHRERIRVHHGAREILGRVVLFDREAAQSGDSVVVQLVLEKPLIANEGDFFVLRKYSPQRVFAGGVVIDPVPLKHKLSDKSILRNLEMLEKGGSTEKTLKTIMDSDLQGILSGDLDQKDRDSVLDTDKILLIEGRLFAKDVLKKLAFTIFNTATAYQKSHPLLYGIDKEELKQKADIAHPAAVFNKLLEELSAFKTISIKGSRVRAGKDNEEIPEKLAAALGRLEQKIKDTGLRFVTPRILEKHWAGGDSIMDALQHLKEKGRIVKIGDNSFVHTSSLDECSRKLKAFYNGKADLTVAEFKDIFGLTRKHAIPLLEYLDARKITVRSGDSRKKGPAL